jgi:hypothetical protein
MRIHAVIPSPTEAWGQAKAGPHTGHSQELGIQTRMLADTDIFFC